MREELLNEVFQELQERQSRNEETERRRRREIGEKYPEIQRLTEKRAGLIADAMNGILRGEAAPEDLSARMDQASAEIREALRKNGYPEDYLAPVYTCSLCLKFLCSQ